MKKIKGRMISILLSIVVAAGLLPVSSFASENIKYEADADIERAEYAEDSEHAEDPKTAERPAHVNEPQTGELPDPGELPEADGFAAAPKDPAPEPEQITVLAEGSSEELPPPSADALFEAAPGEEGEDGAVSPEDSEEEEYGRVRAAGAIDADEVFEGSGTEEDPWLIGSVEDLQTLAAIVNSGDTLTGAFFSLADNLDLSGVCGEGKLSWKPIGKRNIPFNAVSVFLHFLVVFIQI